MYEICYLVEWKKEVEKNENSRISERVEWKRSNKSSVIFAVRQIWSKRHRHMNSAKRKRDMHIHVCSKSKLEEAQ
jgi:hypothetical protein